MSANESSQEKINISSNKQGARKSKVYKETFFGRVFQKLIESGIPIQKALNIILVGYLVGIALTVLWYKYISSKSLNTLRWICFLILGLKIILLSYSKDVRCVATLSLPILCSSKGRSVIIAVAFFLSATGPTVNMFHNIDVMVSSLSCGQMQLKEALVDMLDTLKKPMVAIKDAIRNVVTDLRQVLKKVQQVLLSIQALIVVILAVMKNAFGWLRNIVSMCNREFGTPYERCMKISKDAIEDCEAKLGAVKGLCQVTHIFSMLCYATKIVDAICILVVFVNESIIITVMEKLQMFTAEVKKLFDVSITFDHDFYFKTTTSRELSEVRRDIMLDIHRRMKTFVLIFGWLDVISLLMFVVIIFKAIYFRLKYIHNPGYQNCYISKEFVEIDENRKNMNMETALPLTFVEKLKYPRLTDCMLTRQEWLTLARSGAFLAISSIQLFCICFADYSLFWILSMISYYGHKELGFTMSFFKLARRKARLTFTKNKSGDNFTFLDWLRAKTEGYCFCRFILGHRKANKCLLCGTPLNDTSRVSCQTLGCKALYCKNCFQESHNICCICHNPVDYGDLSDLSEVEDSSDDPEVIHIDETDDECLIKKWNEHIDK